MLHILANAYLHGNSKTYVSVTSDVGILMLWDFSRLEAIAYAVEMVTSRKPYVIEI